MFVFRKIWRALFSCNNLFKIRPFALLKKGLPVIDEPITQCDSLVVENTFVGDCN